LKIIESGRIIIYQYQLWERVICQSIYLGVTILVHENLRLECMSVTLVIVPILTKLSTSLWPANDRFISTLYEDYKLILKANTIASLLTVSWNFMGREIFETHPWVFLYPNLKDNIHSKFIKHGLYWTRLINLYPNIKYE
jgi:hypothetical protein